MEADLFHVGEGPTDMKLTGAFRNSAKEPSKPNVSIRDSGSQVYDYKRIPHSGILYHKLWKGLSTFRENVLSPSSLHKILLPDNRGRLFLRHNGNFQFLLPRHSVKDSRSARIARVQKHLTCEKKNHTHTTVIFPKILLKKK